MDRIPRHGQSDMEFLLSEVKRLTTEIASLRKPHCQRRSSSQPTTTTIDSIDINQSYRLFVTDRTTATTFLIDTGANISVLPPQKGHTREALKPLPFQLYAANNTVIPTYGEKTMTLDLKLRRPFKWRFIVAKVSQPIIGADFLQHHQLIFPESHD